MTPRERDRLFGWIVLIIVTVVLGCVHRAQLRENYGLGYKAGVRARQPDISKSYDLGFQAGAEETAAGAFEAGRDQGRIDQLIIWNEGGNEAMAAQWKVIKEER